MRSDSSSQSCAESLACSGPYNCVTAAMKEDGSRSAKYVCFCNVISRSTSDRRWPYPFRSCFRVAVAALCEKQCTCHL